jgi:hypothetical protein
LHGDGRLWVWLAKEIRREFPPLWKMLLYCAVLPALVLGGVFLYCQHVGLDGQALEQTRRNFFILPTGCVLMFMVGLRNCHLHGILCCCYFLAWLYCLGISP